MPLPLYPTIKKKDLSSETSQPLKFHSQDVTSNSMSITEEKATANSTVEIIFNSSASKHKSEEKKQAKKLCAKAKRLAYVQLCKGQQPTKGGT